MRKRLLHSVALALFLLFVVVVPVLAAAYSATFTITESGGTAYSYLPVVVSSPNTWMSTNGFMKSTALDTRVQTIGGLVYPHMVADDKILAVPTTIPASGQVNLVFATGNTDLTSMDIVTGYGGYITRADTPTWELGNNFEVETSSYISTVLAMVGNSIVRKSSSFKTYVDAAGSVTSEVYGASWVQPTSTNDPGAAWGNDANAIDGNTGTVALTSTNFGYSGYLETPHAVISCNQIRFYAPKTNTETIDVDVYDDDTTSWINVYEGAYTANAWEVKNVPVAPLNLSNIRVRFNWAGIMNPELAEIQYGQETVAASVTAAVASGSHTVKTTADGANLKLYIDSVEEDSTAFAGTVIDNNNDIIFNQNNVCSWFDYIKWTVSGTLVGWYQPVTIINTTVLPDRQGAAENGAITWGANPAGVAVALGGMVSAGQPSVGGTTTTTPADLLPGTNPSNWFVEPDVTGALLTNPLRPIVTMVSDNTALSELQTWRWFGILVVVMLVGIAIRLVPRHLVIACVAGGVATVALVVMTIWPLWTLTFLALFALGGWISERSPSV